MASRTRSPCWRTVRRRRSMCAGVEVEISKERKERVKATTPSRITGSHLQLPPSSTRFHCPHTVSDKPSPSLIEAGRSPWPPIPGASPSPQSTGCQLSRSTSQGTV
jgi:hypothetical protein